MQHDSLPCTGLPVSALPGRLACVFAFRIAQRSLSSPIKTTS